MSEKITSFAPDLGDCKELPPAPQIRVVEIGYGSKPACYEGGRLFNNPHVVYDGIDLPVESNSWGEHFPDDERNRFFVGDFSHLPYDDESVDYVMLRSVFGQRKNVRNSNFGILEAARVLRIGGQLVISEENTPIDAIHLWGEVIGAGLGIRDFHFTNQSSPEIGRLIRGMFYERPVGGLHDDAPGGWLSRPYILIAEKYPGVEREEFYMPICPAYTDGSEPGHDTDYPGRPRGLITPPDAVVRRFLKPAFPERDIPELANVCRE